MRKVAESPPPHRPPLEVISHVPDALEPVLDVAKSEFPNPLIPVTLFKEILASAIRELREESKRAQPHNSNAGADTGLA